MNNQEIIVSICCITYNHESYIAQAIESFLMQKTNFNYELIIGEDCSTDNTRAIIEQLCKKYPGRIKLVGGSKNVGAVRNHLNVIQEARGKYIATCDGDDYWVDPLKLQKQVDFMENNPDYTICCHYTRVINEKGELVYENPLPIRLEYHYEDVLMGNREETRMCSLMVKNNHQVRDISKQDWYYKTYGSDTLFKLFALSKTAGKMCVLPEVMGVYRLHRGGVWSLIDSNIRKNRSIDDFNIMISNFQYSSSHKRKLLAFYLNRYFLFDIKTLNISRAFYTLFTLI